MTRSSTKVRDYMTERSMKYIKGTSQVKCSIRKCWSENQQQVWSQKERKSVSCVQALFQNVQGFLSGADPKLRKEMTEVEKEPEDQCTAKG